MNFKKFDVSDNQWHDIPYYQHKTATDTLTLPAVIYPNDTSITVGVKGNEEHTGTPTPQNPVVINGTGDMSSNLFDISTWNNATATRGTISISENTVTLTASGNDCYSNTYAQSKYNIPVTGGETYTLSWETDYKSGILYVFTGTSVAVNVLVTAQSSKKSVTFTVPENRTSLSFRLGASTTGEVGVYSNIMLNVGEEALPYEPYGYKIPILLNNQTINKYLGTEQTTRQIKKLVLTGQETWYSSNTYTGSMYAYHSQFPNILAESKIYCSHLPYSEKSEYQYGTCCSDENSISLWMFDTTTSPSAFKSYIASEYEAGHPVTIWYILATPQTDVVNEPLMKIGNYADSLNTSVPCTAGENTLDVQTTLQPSEVTAEFSGWHPVQSVHERENGQWD